MPHQCTDCSRSFDDGSQEMLSGCPDCGGNTFQYQPSGSTGGETEAPEPAEEPPEPPEPPVDSSVARTVGNAATAVRDLVGSSPSPPEPAEGTDDPSPAGSSPPEPAGSEPAPAESASADPAPTPTDPGPETGDTAETVPAEDTAQASARSDIVSKEELPPAPDSPATTERPTPVIDDDSDGTTAAKREAASSDDADRDRPDLSELRSELNDQFESIKVLNPGKYELNLMELYDREEYIIALQEDGKYTIQVPERWED
jgi:predicted  nucleic acid-binding Zn-ribbon protein